jgi:hypothetical protein
MWRLNLKTAVEQVFDTASSRSRLSRIKKLPSRDRKEAVLSPRTMATQDEKAVAQVIDFTRDHSEAVSKSTAPHLTNLVTAGIHVTAWYCGD